MSKEAEVKVKAVKAIVKEAESFADQQLMSIGLIAVSALNAIRRIVNE